MPQELAIPCNDEVVAPSAGPSVPIDRPPQQASVSTLAEKKFIRLRDEWKAQRGPESSTAKLVMHPAYQTIIGMGPVAVPLLLRELETNLDSWFWALRAITETDPVPTEDRGNGAAMVQAWLAWGKKQGYRW